jgi:type VII secretion-associated serine protease mycosin
MGWRRAAVPVTAVFAVLVVPVPARAAEVCQTVAVAAPISKGTPLEDQVYAPGRLAAFATGRGVRVAVIDSGVDAGHPQLRGRVGDGRDFLHGEPDGRQDCVGHGTAVASLIAAGPVRETGFQGLAPDAEIVPIRISEQAEIDGKAVGDRGTPAQFAAAIDFAVDAGVQVINLSLVMTDDNALVERSVERAVAADVVVVAAAGNRGGEQDGNPTPYPAAYRGVIGVGAVTADGTRAPYSQHGPYVDLVAMGDRVTVAARAGGHRVDQGTSFATPFVSATVALIRQRFPDLSPAQVEQRLEATADPAPGGARSDDYGFGLLNPYRAVTQNLGPAKRPAAAPQVMRPEDPAALAVVQRREHSQNVALVLAAVAAGLVLLIAVVAVVVRRGCKRGWRPPHPTSG